VPFARGPQHNIHLLQQLQHHQQQQHLSGVRLEALYESHSEDRTFVPDGMVPGLRTNVPRNREAMNMYPDSLDDSMQYPGQRLPTQRAPDSLYNGGPPNFYGHQAVRGAGNAIQQSSHYRGGPSPISAHHGMHPVSQQRLPPGLANLGGRPPHESSQQLLGVPGIGPQGLPLNRSGGQLPFNGFSSNTGFGNPQMRAPMHLSNHGQTQAMASHLNIDIRSGNQTQFSGGMAGPRVNGFPGQPISSGGIPPIRQQPQQHLPPPQMMNHLQSHTLHQGASNQTNQQSHDLMALLLGGAHRE
jgi:zinc finger CCCH domain-containing protein 13